MCISPPKFRPVERMTLTKLTLTKLTLETGDDWVSLLPFILLRVRNTSYVDGITPYEMSGRPPPTLPHVKADLLAEISDYGILKSIQAF